MAKTTPRRVYYWIQNEYQKLDKLDTGKIDGVVFSNAAKHFGVSRKSIQEYYDSFIYTNETVMAGFGAAVNTDIQDAQLLEGKKVKINVGRIMKHKKQQSSKGYLDFVNDNKNKEFIARVDGTVKSMLYLEGHDFWLFDSRDLIVIE